MSTETFSGLYEYLRECQKTYPNLREFDGILKRLSEEMVSQVIFDFGGDTIRCILSYFEEIESYEKCRMIMKRIEIHNRVHGTDI